MADFLDTTGISFKLERIIKNANKHLVLVSPFLKTNKRIRELLEDKAQQGIDVRIIYGKKELQPEEESWLKSITGIKISFCENLHAKCYMSESEAIITSMNLYEFSQTNNYEVGIHVIKDEDIKLFEDIFSEVKWFIRISEQVKHKDNRQPEKIKTKKGKKVSSRGSCIRCGKTIKLDPLEPYCKDCYYIWRRYEDEEYPENYCHICGIAHTSSMIKPTCYSCYKENRGRFVSTYF